MKFAKIALIAAAAAMGTLAQSAETDTAAKTKADTIRVMTYNIYGGKGIDKKLNLKGSEAVIRRAKPDIVGLQEVDVKSGRSQKLDMPKLLGEALGMQYAFAKTIDVSGGAYGIATLSKLPFTVVDTLPMPTAQGAEKRVAMILKAEKPRPFYFIVTHLSWESKYEKQRIEGMKSLKKLIDKKNYKPAILVGDFNEGLKSGTIRELRKNWMIANDTNPQPTFNVNGKGHKDTIDYICFYPKTAFKVLSCKVLEEPTASDHCPVLAELEFAE